MQESLECRKDRMTNQKFLVLAAILALLFALLLLALLLVLYVALNCPISPSPLKLPTSNFSNNNILQGVKKLGDWLLDEPEDICFDKTGTLYAVTRDGWIKRMRAGNNETWEAWKFLGGDGLLGLTPSGTGGVLVFDAYKGLVNVSEEGITYLTSEVNGTKFGLADEGIEADDGTVYFTDASTKFALPDWFLDVLEAKPHGRLIKYDPSTKKTSVMLEGLAFANGVALPRDQKYLIYCETWKFHCKKYWLEGDLKGQTEIFIDNLPGGPDNIHLADDDTYWIALLQLRSGFLDLIHRWPLAKRVVASFPKLVQFLLPMRTRATVINVPPEGKKICRSLDDSNGTVINFITSVVEYDGHLYLGNRGTNFVGKLDLKGINYTMSLDDPKCGVSL